MASDWDAFKLVGEQQPTDAGWDNFRLVEPQAPQAPMSIIDIGADALKGLGTGIARGAAYVLGQGGDINKGGRALVDQMRASGAPVDQRQQQLLSALPEWLRRYHETPAPDLGSAEIMQWADKASGLPLTSYEPRSFAGKASRTVGEFIPAAALTRTGILGGAVLPGVVSETAGTLTEGTKAEPWARVGGAVAGGFLPSALSRLVTPFPASPAKQNAAAILQNEGVDALTAGQRVGNKGLQYLEDARGQAAASDMMQRQGEQFTSAVLRRAGINAPRATPEVIDDAFRRIGGEFDYLAQRSSATVDRAMVADLRNTIDNYNNLVSPPNRTPAVQNFLTEINTAAQRSGGDIGGQTYQSLRSRMERIARGMTNNPEAREAIRGMREAIDDAMERTLRRSGQIDDVAAWQEARRQYRNMIVIERAATGAGERAAEGLVTPAKLREATVSAQGRRNYARGDGDFADLARAGNSVMTPLPNSGTAQRNLAQNLGAGIPAILGGYGGSQAGGAEGAALGAMAGFLAPRVAGRAMMSRPGQAYLSNQVLADPLRNPNAAAQIYRALIAAQQAQQAQPAVR